MKPLTDLVAGKSVALVGNASSILARQDGARIDAHDVVIRINLGLPHIMRHHGAIGHRTDIWVAAKWWGERMRPRSCKLVVFTKMTAIGDRDWAYMQEAEWNCPLVRWTHELAAECTIDCKCDPGSGLRTLWFLKRKAQCKEVSVYGFDCWKTVSTWSGKMNTPNHDPAQESRMVEQLCTQ